MTAAVLFATTLASPAAAAAAVHRPGNGFPQVDSRDSKLTIRLLDVPAARISDQRARLYIVDHLEPGATIRRRVEVHNASSEPQHIELYTVGASIVGNTFTAAGSGTGNDLAGWVTLEAASLDLAPGVRKPVKVIVKVPVDASEGERYAAVLAQITRPHGEGGNINQVLRVGVRMYLSIGAGGEPATDFRIDGVTVSPGPAGWPIVTAQVHNIGHRALDMTGTVSLSRETGTAKAGPFAVSTGVTILPGQSAPVHAELNEPLPDGGWKVHVVLASGTVQRQHTGRVFLHDQSDVASAKSTARSRFALFIESGVALVAALMLALMIMLWYRRHRIRAPR